MGIQIFILLITAVISAAIASAKGRSVIGWFIGGFFLGLIGVIIVAVLPNLKEQRERQERQERENRRLREQLRQERLKQEAFRQHAAARLDVHDEYLGLDTRAANQPMLPGSAPPAEQLTGDPADALDAMTGGNQRDWFYERNGEAVGPASAEAIRAMLDEGRLDRTSLVWSEHLGDWKQVDRVPEFRGAGQ